MKTKFLIIYCITAMALLHLVCTAYAQSMKKDTTQTLNHTYPEIKGYAGLVHPIYTWTAEGNVANFDNYYIVGNPWGINIWKSKKFGITYEFTPFIRSDTKGSKLTNFLFHPGVIYRVRPNFMLIGRAAYETSGRFGFTPIVNKILVRGKQYTFFVAALAPVRFGNNHKPSVTAAFQFGIGF